MDEANIAMTISYQKQLIDKLRLGLYNQELKHNLLVKMLEEKNMFAPQETEKRWPIYLKSDIGAIGPDGIMSGSLKVSFYGCQ